MTNEEKIQECEKICTDANKIPWQKFKEITYYYCLPYEEIDITNDINCPICTEFLTQYSITDDFDICAITVDGGKAFYEITTPCCGKVIYTTDNWKSNLYTEADMWEEARNRYRKHFLEASETYDRAKAQYATLCDLIYDKDFLKL